MAVKVPRMKKFLEEETIEVEKESVLLFVREEQIGNIKKRERGGVV